MAFVHIVIDGFEWDEDKAAENEARRGIRFEDADLYLMILALCHLRTMAT
jgi:uncharacterized DUF497 family protein